MLSEVEGSSVSITKLDLSWIKIRDVGARGLGSALAASNILTPISLHCCGIRGEECCALSKGVGSSPSITKLDLEENQIGEVGARGLGAALEASSTMTSLLLYNCGIKGKGAM